MSSSGFAALCSAFGRYDVVHIHAEGPAFFAWLPKLLGKRVVVTIHYNALRERNGDTDPARIVIGKDTRRSSYMFEYSLVAGLTASGADAYLLHVTTTPSVAYIARVDDFDCGIMISASHNNLTEVVETKNIVKTADGAEADGVVVDVNSLVSMNMWGLTPDFLDVLEDGFKEFFEKEVPGNPQKAEYLIPIFIGELLEQGKMSVKVLKTNDTWYGMTYHEDVAAVKGSFKEMLENGVYKADLFSDL